MKVIIITVLILLLIPAAVPVWCDGNPIQIFATDASTSVMPFLAAGELSLLADGRATKPEMIQGAKALAATCLLTELLKNTVREKRPNSDSRTSFPSGHTSMAFAMATVLADYHPNCAIPAYLTATTIGWSRVEVGAHRWQDVAAGAALGYFTAKHFTGKHITVSPAGVSFQWKW